MTRDANIANNTTTTTTTLIYNNNNKIPLSTTLEEKQQPAIVTFASCIPHVLSFLSRSDLAKLSVVSKSWHVATAQKLWSSFKFVKEREFERIFHILSKSTSSLRYGKFITSLELIHSDRDFSINSNHIFLITMLCPNLSSISITFHHTRPVAPPVPLHMVNKIAAPQQQQPSNPRLPLPILARQHQQQQQASTQAPPPPVATPRYTTSLPLAHFAHNCPKLKSIRLTSYSPKTDDSLYEMAKYMTSGSLESIKFTNCPTIQSSTLSKLAMTNPQLKSVEIMGNTPMTDSGLATIADRCGSHLEYLSIGNAHQLTDKSIRYIAARCKKIRQLCIFNNNIEKITEDTLTSIITHCPTLQMISLSDSRTLGATFFDAALKRIRREVQKIVDRQAPRGLGLQTLCLGGVKREIVTSRYIRELIDLSASKFDLMQDTEDTENTEEEDDNVISHLVNNNHKFMPKSTVIRGSTIWWQRRRLLATTIS